MCRGADPNMCAAKEGCLQRPVVRMNCGHAVCHEHRRYAYDYNISTR